MNEEAEEEETASTDSSWMLSKKVEGAGVHKP